MKTSMIRLGLLALLLTATCASWSFDAAAACITGQIGFRWALGNYCDWDDDDDPANGNNRDCTGWKYARTRPAVDVEDVPVKEAKVQVFTLNDQPLASGELNTDGEYDICYSGTQTQVKVQFRAEHKSGAFSIRSSSGAQWVTIRTRAGTGFGQHAPIGTEASPSAVWNMYYSAYASLKNVAKQMDITNGTFTGVEIWTDSESTQTRGYDKWITVADSLGDEFGMAAIPHEIGHVLHHMSSQSTYLGCDNSNKGFGVDYEACGGDGGHGLYSVDDCADSRYAEGLATFFAAAAIENRDAENECWALANPNEQCLNVYALDRVMLESNSCPSSGQNEAQITQYLWDTYDASTYTPLDGYDDILHLFPNGRADHNKSENWCCTAWYCTPCDHNDYNILDFAYHRGTYEFLSTHCLL